MTDPSGLSAEAPSRALAPYVQSFYHASGESTDSIGGPGLSVDLWWFDGPAVRTHHLGGSHGERSGLLIGGALTRTLAVSRDAATTGVGVSFVPTMAPALFGIDSRELKDDFIDLSLVDPEAAKRISERLGEARGRKARVAILEEELLAMAAKRGEANAHVQYILNSLSNSLENASVDGLADSVGYTRRRLQDLVKSSIGVSPKELIQILRFRKALRMMEGSSSPDWMDVVYACGYADQPHFIRNCRKFTGLSPSQYHAQRLFPPLA